MTVQIIEIAGQKLAMLPVADYERLIDIAEDRADSEAAFNASKRRREGEDYLPAAMVDRLLAGENAVKVWREHRGLTAKDLAQRVGTTPSSMSRIEAKALHMRPALWRALARELGVAIDDILPVE